jgi:hypothetical protein
MTNMSAKCRQTTDNPKPASSTIPEKENTKTKEPLDQVGNKTPPYLYDNNHRTWLKFKI